VYSGSGGGGADWGNSGIGWRWGRPEKRGETVSPYPGAVRGKRGPRRKNCWGGRKAGPPLGGKTRIEEGLYRKVKGGGKGDQQEGLFSGQRKRGGGRNEIDVVRVLLGKRTLQGGGGRCAGIESFLFHKRKRSKAPRGKVA